MRRLVLGSALLCILFVIVFHGCTDANLEQLPPQPPRPLDNKLEVTGSVCTQNPEDLEFPVRVLFLVDGSESMEVNDPPDPTSGQTGRERAVEATVRELLEDGSGDIEVSVVRFTSSVQPLTVVDDGAGNIESYFTSDLDLALSAVPRLAETNGTTNYVQALSEAYAEIRHELMNADQESLALSTYHVIMLTDGIPDVEGDDIRENSDANILDSIQGIMDLGHLFRVGKMTVNTALLSSGNPLVDAVAGDLLGRMADAGGGTYRSFASGGELNFVFVDLAALKRIFTVKTLVVQNLNAQVKGNDVLADSDGDGMADIFELATGSNPFDPDSDGDGCRDGLEHRYRSSGMDPNDPGDCGCFLADPCYDLDSDAAPICDCTQGVAGCIADVDSDGGPVDCIDNDGDGRCDCADVDADGECDCVDADADGLCDCIDLDFDGRCDPANYRDNDGDGLFDCEERFTGTSRNGPDSDGDGLVDFLEIRFGTAPDIDDDKDDNDWDAVVNGEEVRTATDPTYANEEGRSSMAYRYFVSKIPSTGLHQNIQEPPLSVDTGAGDTDPTDTGEEPYSGDVPGISCYEFTISNISLTDTLDLPEDDTDPDTAEYVKYGPAGQGFSNANRIMIFVGEVPFDDMNSYARFRVACVEASFQTNGNYKNPPSGRINIDEAVMSGEFPGFVELTQFDPELHCLRSGG